MRNSKPEGQTHSPLIDQLVTHYKQASILTNDSEQGLLLNAILNTDEDINLGAQSSVNNTKDALITGQIRSGDLNQDHILALLLDPQDISALIESNLVHNINQGYRDPLLFSANNDKTILKIEDVLHEDDSLDKYLPLDQDKWYLYGDGQAIDKAISSPSFRDIHDDLIMQQLLTQNYAE